MNRQEVYNKVKNHLLTQMEVSEIEIETKTEDGSPYKGMSCAYRGPNGRKCSIGCLILDEHFRAEINGDLVTDHRVWKALQLSGIIYEPESQDERFLSELQIVHDNHRPGDWAQRLAGTAVRWRLQP